MAEVRNHCVYIAYTEEYEIYVGMTALYDTRIAQHLQGHGNSEVYKLRDYITFERIQSNLTESEAENLEIKLIEEYSNDKAYKILNKSLGGQLGTKGTYGEKSSRSKLKDIDIINIRNEYANNNITQKFLATKYNVSNTTMSNILRGKRSSQLSGTISLDKVDKFHPNRKITNLDVLYIRDTCKFIYNNMGSFDIREFANIWSVSAAHFSRILRGTSLSSVGGPILGKDYWLYYKGRGYC